MGNQQTIRQISDISEMLVNTINEGRVPLQGIMQMIQTVCNGIALECEYGHITEEERREYIWQIQDCILHGHIDEPRRKKIAPVPAATGTSAEQGI